MDVEKTSPTGTLSQKSTLISESSARTNLSSSAPEVYYKGPDSLTAPEVYRFEAGLQTIDKGSAIGFKSAHAEPEVYYGEEGLHSLPQKTYSVDRAPESHQLQSDQSRPNQQHPKSTFQKHRVLWLLFAVIVLVACLAIGLGVGLHFRFGNHNSSSLAPQPETPNPITSTSSSAISSATSSASSTLTLPSTSTVPVTSGSTGVAADDCGTRGSNTYTTNNNPTTFNFECRTDYPNGDTAYSGSGTVSDLSARLITYTLEECVENCAIYNEQNPGSTACAAITYNANLTESIGGQEGNCFLKSTRGMPVVYNDTGGATVASAYAVLS